jgi:hypothetical protein
MLIWLGCLLAMFKLQLALAPKSWFVFFTILGIGAVLAAAGAWWLNRYMANRANYVLGFYGERIIVAPSGVYVVETKARRKRKAQKGKPDHIIIFDGDTLTFPHDEQSRYGLDQARNNAKWLSGYLSSATGEKVWVEPILTFPGWMINRRTINAAVQVLNPKEIGDFVVSRPARLTAQGIRQIVHQLDQKCRDVEF